MVAGAEVGVGEAEADAEEAVVNMNTRAVDLLDCGLLGH